MRGLITGDGEDRLLGILSKYTLRGVWRTVNLGNYEWAVGDMNG